MENRDDEDNVDGVDLVMARKHSTSNDDILDEVSASNVNVMSKPHRMNLPLNTLEIEDTNIEPSSIIYFLG